MSLDRRGGRHLRTQQMCPPTLALPAVEIPVRRGRAALARLELVRIHRKAHTAARMPPLGAEIHKDFIQALGFRLLLTDMDLQLGPVVDTLVSDDMRRNWQALREASEPFTTAKP